MNKNTTKKLLLILCIILLFVTISSIFVILFSKQNKTSDNYIAKIYQDGIVLYSIPLYEVKASYTITIHGENKSENIIQIEPAKISIISASCPDKICINQGAIENSLFPITCLPNHLIITLEATSSIPNIDIVTY